MVEVHAFATPNSVKVPIALDEMGLACELKPVDVRKAEQKQGAFIALNANRKVPVLGERFVPTESAAILVYLAEMWARASRSPTSPIPAGSGVAGLPA